MPGEGSLLCLGSQDSGSGLLKPLQKELSACIQCGTCTASCRNARFMEPTPRKLWRLVVMGLTDEVFKTRTFALCSTCYYCTLRCPRGLAITDAMQTLKQIAAEKDVEDYRPNARFYGSFMESVRRHGRVNEMEFMRRYFFLMKSPAMPLKFAPLGIRLLKKGKISLFADKSRPEHPLDDLFKRVEEVEKGQ